MKLDRLIASATGGLTALEREVDRQAAHVTSEGKKLTKLREEYAAHREMLNAMLKLQDQLPANETLDFRDPGPSV